MASSSKDAWYHGPDSIVSDDEKTFIRLPHRFYMTDTGPSKKNCEVLKNIFSIYLAGNIRFNFPFSKDQTKLYKAGPASFGNKGALSIHPHETYEGDRPEDFEESMGGFTLGNFTAKQPMVFVEREVYKRYYTLVESLQTTVLDALGPLKASSVTRALDFYAENGQEVYISKKYRRLKAYFHDNDIGPHYQAEVDDGKFVLFGVPTEKIEQYAKLHPELIIESNEGWILPNASTKSRIAIHTQNYYDHAATNL